LIVVAGKSSEEAHTEEDEALTPASQGLAFSGEVDYEEARDD
jgi:hypothetical protein